MQNYRLAALLYAFFFLNSPNNNQNSFFFFFTYKQQTQLRWTEVGRESIPNVVTVEAIDEDIASEIQEVYS